MFTQLIPPDLSIPYVGGWCEGYVSGAWGLSTIPTVNNQQTSSIPGVRGYSSAKAKWEDNPGNGNHPDELPPEGVCCPIYFSLPDDYWHVAISLGDGRVLSSSLPGFNRSGYMYASIQDLIDDYAKYNGGCTYLGFSEYVCDIQVIKEEYMKATANDLKYLYLGVYAESVPDDKLASDPFVGTDMGTATMEVLDYANKNGTAYWQVKPKLEKQIADLSAQVLDLQNKLLSSAKQPVTPDTTTVVPVKSTGFIGWLKLLLNIK